jgi:hypothetical protein
VLHVRRTVVRLAEIKRGMCDIDCGLPRGAEEAPTPIEATDTPPFANT